MSDQSTGDTDRCDRCGDEGELTTLSRDGHEWATFCIPCHDEIVEFALETSGESEQTPQKEWEAHNESFTYEPPERPPEAWSSKEYQKLHDRFISRQTQWFCDKCSGRGPMRSLQKARHHVQSQHGPDLVDRYAPDKRDLETATDGGNPEDRTAKNAEQNHGLGDFADGGK